MDEVLIFWVFLVVLRHLLALIDASNVLSLALSEVSGGCKVMALVEVMKVGSIFVDRLRAFLVLAWNSKTHVGPAYRVSSRVELLDALC